MDVLKRWLSVRPFELLREEPAAAVLLFLTCGWMELFADLIILPIVALAIVGALLAGLFSPAVALLLGLMVLSNARGYKRNLSLYYRRRVILRSKFAATLREYCQIFERIADGRSPLSDGESDEINTAYREVGELWQQAHRDLGLIKVK